MTDEFTDSEGRKCDLSTMCRREPGWAASRIGALRERAERAEREREEARDLAEHRGDQIVRLYVAIKDAERERDETLDILVEIEMLCRELAPWIQAHQDDEPDSSWYPRLVRLAIEHHRRIVDTHRRIVDTQAATITNMSSQNANVCAALYAEQDRTNALRDERDAAIERAERAEMERDEERRLADVRGEMLTKAEEALDACRRESSIYMNHYAYASKERDAAIQRAEKSERECDELRSERDAAVDAEAFVCAELTATRDAEGNE